MTRALQGRAVRNLESHNPNTSVLLHCYGQRKVAQQGCQLGKVIAVHHVSTLAVVARYLISCKIYMPLPAKTKEATYLWNERLMSIYDSLDKKKCCVSFKGMQLSCSL